MWRILAPVKVECSFNITACKESTLTDLYLHIVSDPEDATNNHAGIWSEMGIYAYAANIHVEVTSVRSSHAAPFAPA